MKLPLEFIFEGFSGLVFAHTLAGETFSSVMVAAALGGIIGGVGWQCWREVSGNTNTMSTKAENYFFEVISASLSGIGFALAFMLFGL